MHAQLQHRCTHSSSRRRGAGGCKLLRSGRAAAAGLLAACVLLSAATRCGGAAAERGDALATAAAEAQPWHAAQYPGTHSIAPRRALLLAHAPAPGPVGDAAEHAAPLHRAAGNSTRATTTTSTTTSSSTSTSTSSSDSSGTSSSDGDASAQSLNGTATNPGSAPQKDLGTVLRTALFVSVTSSLLALLCLALYPTYFFPCPTFGIGVLGFFSPFASSGTTVIVN